MELLTLIFFILFSGYSSGKLTTVEDCGKSFAPEGRIVNGTVTTHGKFPWMVSIHERISTGFKQSCGGAILNENWIVSAAHCFDKPINLKDYEVYVGLYSILEKDAPTVQKFELSKIIPHENYTEDGYANDIALLQTATEIDINGSQGFVNAICLPSAPTAEEATVIGWGKISSDGPISGELREATVPLVPFEKCKQIYADEDSEFEPLQVLPSMLCAGGKGKDACQYDSGGPLFQYDKEGVATLIGIVSNGAECAYMHYPGLYTNVSAFKSWMDRTMT